MGHRTRREVLRPPPEGIAVGTGGGELDDERTACRKMNGPPSSPLVHRGRPLPTPAESWERAIVKLSSIGWRHTDADSAHTRVSSGPWPPATTPHGERAR